ncbi:MAG: DNA repair protein RecO [Candidatus Goldbacteria bacterium]|nr:DNA repair protein RecO [Candidatus Goldiibacteriota bacterium]
MEIKTDGIVLKRYKSGESDDITIIFTLQNGKVMVSSKSTQKISSKLRSCLEIFSYNKYHLIKKNNNSQFFKLIGAEHVKMFENIRTSLRKIGFAYLVVDLLNKFLEMEDANREIFELTRDVLHIVDSELYPNIELLESFFKLKLLKFCGFDMTKDNNYLKNKDAKFKSNLNTILYVKEVQKLKFDFDVLKDINMLINSYIINILGEDVHSSKFLESIKSEK